LNSEDPGFDPVAMSPTDSEERRIHEEEIARKRLDKNIIEERQHSEQYNWVGDEDPTLSELAEKITEVQDRLSRIESKIDTLLESANGEET
jgi:hypothetical protein